MSPSLDPADIDRAAELVANARGLLIGAGAGMGVDSGLPDFRGDEGFWNAYPPYRNLGVSFIDMANPRWFEDDPAFAWGFYGHRRNLYRATVPHRGFEILRRWGQRMAAGAFVYTSNVDGQFQRAGFPDERIYEVHGALDYSQCTTDCGVGVYRADDELIAVDESTMRTEQPPPKCPRCGSVARPNIVMFGDWSWCDARDREKRPLLREWVASVDGPIAVVECGAGTTIPTVRSFCSGVANERGSLLRINPREPQIRGRGIGFAAGALATLEAIDARLG